MKSRLAVWILGLLVTVPQVAGATTITFDDVDVSGEFFHNLETPAGYQGLTWVNTFISDPVAYNTDPFFLGELDGTGYLTGIVSPNNVLFKGATTLGSFSSATAFDFNGVQVTSAFGPQTVTFEGWLGASMLYTASFTATTAGPVDFMADFLGVDSVRFYGTGGFGDQIVLDNLVINESFSEVPEPGTMLLLGAGLVAIVGSVRQRRRTGRRLC